MSKNKSKKSKRQASDSGVKKAKKKIVEQAPVDATVGLPDEKVAQAPAETTATAFPVAAPVGAVPPAETATGVPVVQAPAPVVEKKLSLIAAAAVVLKDATGGLNCPAIIRSVTERGLWTPGAGKTPAATLHTAIITEIKNKGEKSRFAKVGRGLFASRSVAIERGWPIVETEAAPVVAEAPATDAGVEA